MILIADSGSTKTSWSLVDRDGMLFEYSTLGINPFFQTEEDICEDLEMNLYPKISMISIEDIFFYGAGCALPEKKELVANALRKFFPKANIEVESDLLAVARAQCRQNAGIACILGTGSNSCFYNGEKIVKNISPLGYILGDEGSGAVLGRLLVSDCMKNQLPQRLIDKFFNKFQITPAEILENVYKKPFPNRFLARFTIFLSENICEPEIAEIVYKGFKEFFTRNVMQYDYENYHVHVIGSIAYHFSHILKEVSDELGISIGSIERSPMKGLVYYHTKN
ncbi:MAG: ATPase [Bacteroidales bacterium]